MRFFVVFAIEILGKNGAEFNVFNGFEKTGFFGRFIAFEEFHQRVVAQFFLRFGRQYVFKAFARERRDKVIQRAEFDFAEQGGYTVLNAE